MFKCLHQIETLKYFKRNCKLSTAPSSFLFVKFFYKPEKDSICLIVLVPTICCEIINECKDNKNIFCHWWACQGGRGGCEDQASLHQRKFKFNLKKLAIYLSAQERDYLKGMGVNHQAYKSIRIERLVICNKLYLELVSTVMVHILESEDSDPSSMLDTLNSSEQHLVFTEPLVLLLIHGGDLVAGLLPVLLGTLPPSLVSCPLFHWGRSLAWCWSWSSQEGTSGKEAGHLGKAELRELIVTALSFLGISRWDSAIDGFSRIYR